MNGSKMPLVEVRYMAQKANERLIQDLERLIEQWKYEPKDSRYAMSTQASYIKQIDRFLLWVKGD